MKKTIALGVSLVLTVMSLAAGGGKQATPENVVNIAGSGAPSPYQWVETNGQLAGYDVEVSNEIAKRAGLVLKWEATEFPALFLGLDSNKYQAVTNNLSKTEARAAKYLYSDNYYIRNKIVIVLRKGRTDIKTIDDLVGKSVPISSTGNTHSLYLEAYNKEHPNATINLVVSEAQATEQINGVATGQYDAGVTDLIIVNEVIKAAGAEFTIVELPDELQEAIAPTKSYFLFSQSSKALQEKWDAALATLISDGTLKDLSIKYFGYDYSR
ncbi:transporter substrate-binding domain-containing protein [Treponema primitia]|uniref:transporter substrate-binding domain-containing protein n=1 Tax=Treponema primitia TaxID=88058 RepID=UPI00025552C0|nr:transporter substrate-binding domain-containing protein [Treponema primitia]